MATDAATRTSQTQREPLTRERVLATALGLVDAHGLDALSMRRLGAALGVEAMSLYKHVANKDALLDGIVEQLWSEVRDTLAAGSADWAAGLESFGHTLREVMHAHPQAATLLVSRCLLPQPALQVYADLLDALREGGFDNPTGARTIRSLCGYTMGYVSAELSSLSAWRTEPGRPPQALPGKDAGAGTGTTDILLWLGRNLPPGTPARLAQAAVTIIDCDPASDFDRGLELAIEGLRHATGRHAPDLGPDRVTRTERGYAHMSTDCCGDDCCGEDTEC